MKRPWAFLSAESSACAHEFEHALQELDGAVGVLVASFREGRKRFVGVAVDLEGSTVRWVEAPIDDAEWAALLGGFTSLRDVLRKETAWVVDREPSLQPLHCWQVAGSELSDQHLPHVDSLLGPEDHEGLRPALPVMPAFFDTEIIAQSPTFFPPRSESRAA